MSAIKEIIENKRKERKWNGDGSLLSLHEKGLELFEKEGVPSVKHEEWKYTRISQVLAKQYDYAGTSALTTADIDAVRLPGNKEANELVFVNGIYQSELSSIRSSADDMVVLSLADAVAGEYKHIIEQNIGHSAAYHLDGINALNNAFAYEGLFVAVKKNKQLSHPIYCYYINDARISNLFSQPRVLFYAAAGSKVYLVEEEVTLGTNDSFINRVNEIVVEENADVHIYKIQNEDRHSNCVKTTHVRQLGVSKVQSVTITLNGGVIRNNLNFILEAPGCESNMYGLYCVKGETLIDNHTIVDNRQPNCLSNELYKGILDGHSTGVFNGKIFVRQDAQKTNAYQSNKNILLSDSATVNTKPQLEIFADDVKCSHGCTVGRLDDEAMFYLKARGIGEEAARALLLHAFAGEILEKIEIEPIRAYADRLISDQLGYKN